MDRLFLLPGEMSNEERLDRLAHSMYYSSDECTGKAAAERKWPAPPGTKVCSSFVADLNGWRVTQDMLRHPSGPHWSELVHPGSVVSTSYGTGPYVVEEIHEHEHYGVKLISFVCSLPDSPRSKNGRMKGNPDGWLNDYLAVDGRLLALLLANNDEVIINTAQPLKQNIKVGFM